MNQESGKLSIQNKTTTLGIELGSTRIKAVLINEDGAPLASGSHNWENRLENGIWTYPLTAVWQGIQSAVAQLQENCLAQYGIPLTHIGALGISAMMHGYMVFDEKDELLVPFRTWRNTITEEAAQKLTEAFAFAIPQRWSIAHLYQAMLNEEAHLPKIRYITTLAGYVHWQLTGQKVVGVGEASGMFPINSATGQFDEKMVACFNRLAAEKGMPWKFEDIFPTVLPAGQTAGLLSAKGAALLGPAGTLAPGIPLCPPEGDAGTGMVATNSVAAKRGNVSAGTSIFAMVVLEKPLSRVYPEIDMVTTPSGKPVAMVHANNCTSDLDAWVKMFHQLLQAAGSEITKPQLYDLIYHKALTAQPDAGGLVSYNYYSGEPITGLASGRPLFARLPESSFTLENFARNLLFSTMATLKIGMDILTRQEKVELEAISGHGGLFTTKLVGQKLMAAALNVPVDVMESAGEGGAWGIALLASYMQNKHEAEELDAYLTREIFSRVQASRALPEEADKIGFETYMRRWQAGLAAEKAACENLFD